jgi:hypothetical protein
MAPVTGNQPTNPCARGGGGLRIKKGEIYSIYFNLPELGKKKKNYTPP